eukprot:COSAG01_NODE_8541_length_2748_cov_3.504719_4_plen_64_part_00
MTLEYLQGLHAAYEDFIADSACAGLGACGRRVESAGSYRSVERSLSQLVVTHGPVIASYQFRG